MGAVTICSDFGAPQNKVSYCFPIYLPWNDDSVVKNQPANAEDMGLIPEDPTCQTNRACAPQLLRLCSGAWKPQLLKPAWPRARAPQQEKPPATRSLRAATLVAPLTATRESLCSNQDPAQPKISKWNLKKEKQWLNAPLNKIIPQLYCSLSLLLLSYQHVHH